MSEKLRWQSQDGQTAVLFALMIIGMVLFTGLAVDGGNVLNVRRITQNAADASALGAVRYMSTADSPTEQALLIGINEVVEANGIPDTNGVPGDEINAHIVAYYTDDRGNRLVSPNCNLVGSCGGNVPEPAFGIEVEVTNPADTFFIGLIDRNTVNIGAGAVAVARGFTSGGLENNVMASLGNCDMDDWPLAGRANNSEFLGGLHSNSWFVNSGNNNHYHGQVTYVTGFDRTNVPANEIFEPEPPAAGSAVGDPFAGLAYTHFAPGSAIANAIPAGNYHDVSILDDPAYGGDADGIVKMREIINQTVYPQLYNPDDKKNLTASDGVVLGPNQLRAGLYYAGAKAIWMGETAGGNNPGTNGTVTIVSGNRIKLTEKDMNLSSFMPQGSAVPGLLMFSDYTAPELADKCNFDPSVDPIINMAGNSGNNEPEVYHHPGDIPKNANPDDYAGCPYPKIDGCYIQSSNVFTGLIYAPNGRVATSGGKTTYIGAIVSWTIDINGDENLFVTNPGLFPLTDPMIFLER